MCGVLGYKGKQQAVPIMQRLMKHLDYRGYDSHGMCFITKDGFRIHKALGAVDKGFSELIDSQCAIGHVRWATNGEATLANAHPHVSGKLALVHNGIVRNVKDITRSGYTLVSDTDTEVLANWLAQADSYEEALLQVDGDYAIIFLLSDENKLFIASRNMPLYIAKCNDEYYVASSLNVFQEVFESYEYAVVENCYMEIGEPNLDWKVATGSPKVILSVGESYNGVITFSEIKEQWRYQASELLPLDKSRKLIMFGCGSSHNAAVISRYFFRDAGYDSEVFIPSELRHLQYHDAQYLAISQSGETKDVLDMCRHLTARGISFNSIVNAEFSAIEKLATKALHLRCGVERGIAATKTFSATLWSLLWLALPNQAIMVAKLLEEAYPLVFGPLYPTIPAYGFNSVFLFGGGITHYVNIEGSLKMKEMATVHAEAVHAAEVKHGPIALVNDQTLSIFVLVNDAYDEQIMENISQVACRGSKILVLCNKERDYKSEVIKMPDMKDHVTNCFIVAIYLQLIAWELGSLRGSNIDRPMNLAKCVTV